MGIEDDRGESSHGKKDRLGEGEDAGRAVEQVEGGSSHPVVETENDDTQRGCIDRTEDEPRGHKEKDADRDAGPWRIGGPAEQLPHARLTESFLMRRKSTMAMRGASVVQYEAR